MLREEYYCTNDKEHNFLKSKGINYTFVKKIKDSDKLITTWKYKKTIQLYQYILEYYLLDDNLE